VSEAEAVDRVRAVLTDLMPLYKGEFACDIPVGVWGSTAERPMMGVLIEHPFQSITGQDCIGTANFALDAEEMASVPAIRAKAVTALDGLTKLVLVSVKPVKKPRPTNSADDRDE
jgi:hypothetical protein